MPFYVIISSVFQCVSISYFHCVVYLTVAEVSFEEEYTVFEDQEMLSVCLEIGISLQRDVIVNVVSHQNTAMG